MAKRRQQKTKPGKTTRIMTRILGALLMLFILLVLLFAGIKFLMADKTAHTVLSSPSTSQARVNGNNGNRASERPPGNHQPNNSQTSQQDGQQDSQPKYSFYDELKRRSDEVEAEINHKINESEQQQNDIEGDNYRIQVGAFRSKDKADRLRARIILRDYPVMILRSNSMYLVQVGPYAQREDAVKIQKRLQREGMQTLLKNYVAQQH